jgi:hypothetical protein
LVKNGCGFVVAALLVFAFNVLYDDITQVLLPQFHFQSKENVMKRRLFAWIVLISFVLSNVGAQTVSAQDDGDEVKPPYRHSEVPPAPPSHPPVGTSRDGMAPAMSQEDLSAQSVVVGASGLSFRYLQDFGVNGEAYLVDTDHLNRPSGLFVDGSDNLFVTEERGHRVLKFTSAGVNTTPTLGHAGIPWGHDDYVNNPRDGAVDVSGNIWVLTSSSVKKFNATTGELLGSIPATDPWQTGSDPGRFGGDNWGMAFGPGETGNDYLYVADANNHRIQIFDTTSTADPIVPLAIIGTGNPETDDSGFNYPTRIAFDSSDNLYVVDSDNTRIQSCTSTDPSNPETNPWTCDTFFGETGVYDSDLTHLDWPTGIAIDSSDNIFIADTNNYRVLKCDLTPTCVVFAGVTLEDGNDNARFAFPSDIALDSSGNVYVSDSDNFRVQKFDDTGALQNTLGVTGVPYLTDTAHIYDPQGVAVAPDGSMYITEGYGNRLLKFNAAGVQQWTVGEPGVGGKDIFHLGNTSGSGPQGNPAIDASGRIYVADSDNNRVQIFNPNGTYYATLGGNWGYGTYRFRCMGGVAIAPVSQDILVVDRCNNRVQVFTSARVYKGTLGVTNEPGDDDSHFNRPWGVAADSAGNIYVSDGDNYRVQKCTLGGGCTTIAGVTGEQGNDFEHFQHPEQIAIDLLDRVYVADNWGNNRVQVFDSTGAYLTTIGGAWGLGAGNMSSPRGVAVDSSGNVYVADSDLHGVEKFANGTPNWQQVSINGFGDLANGKILSLAVFDGKLYAGVENGNTGGQIWESADGINWTAIVSDGFGDSTNNGIDHMLAFGTNLYVGTENYYDDDPDPAVEDWQTNGAQLWRFDGTDWTDVTPDTFDGTTNSEFFHLAEFNGYLYASTWAFGSSHGGEIWRCDGTTACDGTDWTQVVSNGFGVGSNAGISSFASFGGYLYAGTWHDGGDSDKGGQVWRSNDGETWSQVNTDGFGDGGNIAISSLSAFGGYLYAATDTRESGSGSEVWRCQTCSGTDWSQVVDNGLGNSTSQYRPNLTQLGGTLYLVLGNQDTGLNVWRTSNGTTWMQSAADGFGNRNTVSPYFGNSSAVFGTSLYVGTLNWNNGAQIWRTSADQQIDTVTVQSTAAQDGWILESTETSNAGGKMDVSAQNINLGDDASRKQYRGMLSFSTGAALPDNAVITKVTLKIKKQAIKGGGNPVTTFQGIYADIKKGTFGTSALALTDFNLAGSKTKGPFKPNSVSNWYSMDLTSGNAYINKLATSSGLTQIRLRFKLDDNNNAVANYLSFYSGNAPAASKPQLIIEYYVP